MALSHDDSTINIILVIIIIIQSYHYYDHTNILTLLHLKN